MKCLESIYCGRDVVAVLPTAYGKSIIFHLLPSLLATKFASSTSYSHCWNDQIRRTSLETVKAAALSIKRKRNSEDLDSSMGLTGLRDSHVRVLVNVFALTGIYFKEHPFLYEMSGVPCKKFF